MAEMHFGEGAGQFGVVLLVTIGTGLGTVLFSDGKLLPNTELGHLCLKIEKSRAFCFSQFEKRRSELGIAGASVSTNILP